MMDTVVNYTITPKPIAPTISTSSSLLTTLDHGVESMTKEEVKSKIENQNKQMKLVLRLFPSQTYVYT